MTTQRVFAIAAHPDDIEFMMSGTLMRLGELGCELHYMNVANGSCGSDKLSAEETVAVRREEARAAAEFIDAVFHDSLAPDLEIFYNKPLLASLGAIIREVEPDIILTHYPWEYMEDHSNTARLVVSAAFARNMRNFPVEPPCTPVSNEVVIYHSLPYGLTDPLRRPVAADFHVDVSDYMDRKRDMLALHRSQKEWLDVSQGQDSYLDTMSDQCREIGRQSGTYDYAEGWIRHSHLGFCQPDADPLQNLEKQSPIGLQ
jgi:LmbE family N-acetylglucosaminyl deacetylase